MSYAAQADMIARFGEAELVSLTDRDGSGLPEDSTIAAALADADAEIDGYLRGRYTLPLTAVPDVLKRTACVIARWRMVEALGHPNDVARQAYEDARAWLRDVATGKAQLDLATGDETPVQGDGPEYDATDRVFTMDTLEDF